MQRVEGIARSTQWLIDDVTESYEAVVAAGRRVTDQELEEWELKLQDASRGAGESMTTAEEINESMSNAQAILEEAGESDGVVRQMQSMNAMMGQSVGTDGAAQRDDVGRGTATRSKGESRRHTGSQRTAGVGGVFESAGGRPCGSDGFQARADRLKGGCLRGGV